MVVLSSTLHFQPPKPTKIWPSCDSYQTACAKTQLADKYLNRQEPSWYFPTKGMLMVIHIRVCWANHNPTKFRSKPHGAKTNFLTKICHLFSTKWWIISAKNFYGRTKWTDMLKNGTPSRNYSSNNENTGIPLLEKLEHCTWSSLPTSKSLLPFTWKQRPEL